MTLFQIVALSVFGFLLIATLVAMGRHRVVARVGLACSVVWLAGAIAIAWPGVTIAVARFLGIGRGADLVLYLAILAMFIGFFAMYLRYRKVEEEITKIVRELAIRDARKGEGSR